MRLSEFVENAVRQDYSLLNYREYLPEHEWRPIERIIKAALTERTEQCAKIVDDETIEGQIGQFMLPEIAAKIRALNQPENKS